VWLARRIDQGQGLPLALLSDAAATFENAWFNKAPASTERKSIFNDCREELGWRYLARVEFG